MSLTLYPVFNPPFPETDFNVTGEIMFGQIEILNELAIQHDLVPLTSFADNRELPEDFDGAPDELDDLLEPWDEWFQSGAGADAFEALIAVLEDKSVADRLDTSDYVREELREYAKLLRTAEKAGVHQFRLELM